MAERPQKTCSFRAIATARAANAFAGEQPQKARLLDAFACADAIIAALWVGMFGMMGSLGGSGTQAQIAAASAAATPQPTQMVAAVSVPTQTPLPTPTATPTVAPTAEPTATPTAEPTAAPTAESTEAPTAVPTEAPTQAPAVGTAGASDDQSSTVYIASSGKGKRYHSRPNCSGMKGATSVTEEQAKAMGYTPCKKCY